MEPSIHRIHEQDAGARMEHPGVALWHLSGLRTLSGEGGTPVSPKHQLCASNCCIGNFFPVCSASMIFCLVLSSCDTASKGLTLLSQLFLVSFRTTTPVE